jgi:hypothetical protein
MKEWHPFEGEEKKFFKKFLPPFQEDCLREKKPGHAQQAWVFSLLKT